tara:strand:- start:1045 stop:1968 length:924 start_codon:yes stop_codon:yes gene_type:complete
MAQSSAVSDVGVSAGGLGTAIASAIVQFNKANVTQNCITMSAAPQGTSTVKFPIYTKHDVTHADYGVKNMASGAEETDANLTSIETTAVSLEVLRNAIRAEITDLAAHGNADALLVNAGRQLGNDIAREFDINVCALFDGFATSKGTSTDGLKFLDLMDAVASLESNDAPRPYHGIFHPSQIYGSFGLSNEFGSTAVNASNGAFNGGQGSIPADQYMGAGFVTSLAGINIYTTTAVPNGGDATEKKGAVMSETAIGCGYIDFGGGNFMQMTQEREEVQAKTVLVANGYYAVAELVDLHGVEMHTEIS